MVQNHEKLVRVRVQGDLSDEFDRLVERTKDVWINFDAPTPYPYNYEWDRLSSAMKRYIKEQDEIHYHEYYKRLQGPSTDDYNRRLERLMKVIPDFTDDDFKRYVILGHSPPTPGYKKALDSARRAYQTVNGLLKCNVHEFTDFITLTFAQGRNVEKHRRLGLEFEYVDGLDFAEAKKAFIDWVQLLQRRMKRAGTPMKYVCVWELQGNGNYHFHLISSRIPEAEKKQNPDILSYDTIDREYKESIGLQSWRHGKTDIQVIKSPDRMATYLSKYILKSIYNISEDEEMLERYRGQKKYFPSKGLVRPLVEYSDDVDISPGHEPYETVHHNPYNQGRIETKIYTFLDKKKEAAVTASKSDPL